MKVLLIQPPIQDFYQTEIRLQPIGLCYLKAAVKKFLPEVDVVIKDFHQGFGRRSIPVPKELSYLKRYYAVPDRSPFSTFYHYYHFGASFEQIAEEVKNEKPDLVGISALFSPYYREAVQVAAVVKKHWPVPVLMGGSHVSAAPLSVLNNPAVDFIIRGEGERPLVEFLKVFSNGRNYASVPNLGFKEKSHCILNRIEENYLLNQIPAPDLGDAPLNRYSFENRPLSFVITSRSCPHRCSFCSVHLTFGHQFRRRGVEDVLQELQARYDQGYRVFDFEDDNLTYYKEEMKRLCKRVIESFPGKDIQLLAMNGISYLSLDEELLSLMKEAGFSHLNLALVTSDQTVLSTTKRPHTVQKYLEVVRATSRLKMKVVSYQILGLPQESLDSMVQTLVFNARLPVLLGASLFYLTPASPIAREFSERTEEDIFKSRLTAMAIETDHFSRDDLYTLFVITRILNFLKGIPFEEERIFLAEALQKAAHQDKRSRQGAFLLERLLQEGNLYSDTTCGLKLNTVFKNDLFLKVWSQLGRICTLTNHFIQLQS